MIACRKIRCTYHSDAEFVHAQATVQRHLDDECAWRLGIPFPCPYGCNTMLDQTTVRGLGANSHRSYSACVQLSQSNHVIEYVTRVLVYFTVL